MERDNNERYPALGWPGKVRNPVDWPPDISLNLNTEAVFFLPLEQSTARGT